MHALLIVLAACCVGQQREDRVYVHRGARSVRIMAATVHTWTNGNADGDWNNTANWDTAALPGSGGAGLDTAIFNGDITQVGPSVNMDRVTAADATLFRIIVRENFTGNIGGVGNPLIHEIAVAADTLARFIHRGSGDVYFEAEGVGNDYVHVGTGRSYLDCTTTGDYIRYLAVTQGYVSLASTCYVLNKCVIAGVGVVVDSAAETGSGREPAFTVITAGQYNNAKTLNSGHTIVVFGGKLVQTGPIEDNGLLCIGPQGRATYASTSALGAAHDASYFVTAGLLDLSTSAYAVEPGEWIVTPLGNVLGAPVQQGDPEKGVILDLREEYP